MAQKERQQRGNTKNKEKWVSPITVSTAVIICGSTQLPHHKVIQQNGKHNVYVAACSMTHLNMQQKNRLLWPQTKKTILLVWRSDVMSSVVQGIPAACVRARLPCDGGPMLTGENYWPASSWCPLTASDQPRQLIIQHLRSDDSTQRGTTLESPWVF